MGSKNKRTVSNQEASEFLKQACSVSHDGQAVSKEAAYSNETTWSGCGMSIYLCSVRQVISLTLNKCTMWGITYIRYFES